MILVCLLLPCMLCSPLHKYIVRVKCVKSD